tara:strand:+ start:152 stop:469 length:318 start_codon:yes stop_codon:yes gene_type:complete
MKSAGLFPAVMVDCSHANAQGNYKSQIPVAAHVATNMGAIPELFGIMLESNLGAGSQPIDGMVDEGVSVTDPCLGWDDTEYTIKRVAGIIHELREGQYKQEQTGT